MMIFKGFLKKTGKEICEKLKVLIPRHNFMITVELQIIKENYRKNKKKLKLDLNSLEECKYFKRHLLQF